MKIEIAAQKLGVEIATIQAFANVESRGDGKLSDGRPKILFERHVFYRMLRSHFGVDRAKATAEDHPDICNQTPGGYKGGAAEYDRLAAAMRIDRECAQLSASWGKFQIMGFNYRACGYVTVQDLVNAAQAGEDLEMFVGFINSNRELKAALQAKDWAKAAKLYNGPEYAKNRYDEKLNAEYLKLR